MKQYLYILGLIVMFSGIYTSCKENTLDALHEDEVAALDKYVKDKNLAGFKDEALGIYLKDSIVGTGDSIITSGYKLKLNFKITLMDGTVVFSTEDSGGRSFEEYTFYVDDNSATINQDPIQQIAGLHAGLKKMKVGGRAFMVIPSELAFKAVLTSTGYIDIPRFSTLLAKVYVKSGLSPYQRKQEE
jgi:FKBP-type peptidyl-prolyl cis-trans isomerase